MYCQNRIVHEVQEGDSLYKISRQYGTTVDELILGNPGVNPYNLQIGMRLNVCPGEEYTMTVRPNMPGNGTAGSGTVGNENTLKEEMLLAWLSHIYWMRMYLMAVNGDTADQQAVADRAQETADEIADVFAARLPQTAARQLRSLLQEHAALTADVMKTLKSGMLEGFDELIKAWYGNANQIANLLADADPYFRGRETRNYFLNHLDMAREGIEQQLNGEYAQSIETFRDMEKQTPGMADYFAMGLMA